jgi:ribosomal protein L11 methylase PrmA
VSPRRRPLRLQGLHALVRHLEGAVRRLDWRLPKTDWADYYAETNYTPEALDAKQRLVTDFLERVAPGTVWDLGSNVGLMSRLASGRGIPTVAFDLDPVAVERTYRRCRDEDDPRLLPVWLDLTNPSPALGWANRERESLTERGPVDLVLVLALIHHLAISNNLPLGRLAEDLARLGRWLVVEFVPKDDTQVQRLLAARDDAFERYDRETFEAEFSRHSEILERAPIPGSVRTLYLMRVRNR